MTNIYILKLVGGRYYVGKSENVMKRYGEHLNGSGSAFTQKYNPIALHKTIENASPFDEDRYVKEYMDKYGIDKVRGGSYSSIKLDELQMDALNMEMRGAKDLCSGCGNKGHFIKDCYVKKDVDNSDESDDSEESYKWGCSMCERTFTTKYGCVIHEKSCKKKHIVTWSCEECGKEFDNEKAGKKHVKSCKNNYYECEDDCEVPTCYRCGNEGHKSTKCYAKRHVDGYEI